ncbi:MAG: diguanylate cyclase [Thermodesulfobacteriota bacterium]|nr:diguanylate cyclase [Thermodesulfobacteriota bacterium]
MEHDFIRVLLVDDDEDDFILTRDLLAEAVGAYFDLEWAADYDAGLEAMGREEHDVYLIDYRLGERDGLELLRTAVAKGCGVPVIMLTGHGDRELDVAAMRAGAADFLVKGKIDISLLERSIRYAIDHKRMEEALRESERRYRSLSIRDELTGLYNRRRFFEQIDFEMKRVARHGYPLSLILLDIDDFKHYNDTHGHLKGDAVLVGLGRVISDSIREIDSAYRYGGEEFVVVMPGTGEMDAVNVAERIRVDFGRMSFLPGSGEEAYKTVSIGVVEYKPGESLSDFVERADKNMYRAKALGKNQTFF